MNISLKKPIPMMSLAAAILGLLVFIGVFLPWVGGGGYGIYISFNGFQWDTGWLVFIAALAGLGAGLEGLFMSGYVRMIAAAVMFGAGVIAALITFINLVSVPAGGGPGAGLFICLIAGILLAIVGGIPLYPLVIKKK